jgi:hypothetical protein
MDDWEDIMNPISYDDLIQELKRRKGGTYLEDARKVQDKAIATRQAEISLKAGRQEVAEWTEHNIFYIALNFKGEPELFLQNNEAVLGKRWQAKLKGWGITLPV